MLDVGSGGGLRGTFVGNPVTMRPPLEPGSVTVVISTPSLVPVEIVRPPFPGLCVKSGAVATSEISPSIFSSLQFVGNSLFPGLPVPGRWPPPVLSPSRICFSLFSSTRLGLFSESLFFGSDREFHQSTIFLPAYYTTKSVTGEIVYCLPSTKKRSYNWRTLSELLA